MEIKVVTNNAEMVVAPVGRLDTNTAPELERELGAMPEEISTLIFDFEKLRYPQYNRATSSASKIIELWTEHLSA